MQVQNLHMLDYQINASNVDKFVIWPNIVCGRMQHMGIVWRNLKIRCGYICDG